METAETVHDVHAFESNSLRARATPAGVVLIVSEHSRYVKVFDQATAETTDRITDIAINADKNVFLTAGDEGICNRCLFVFFAS